MSTTIPTSAEIRRDIQARTNELRALRRLLRLAEAAEQVAETSRQANDRSDPPTRSTAGEADHV
jgi:hypothetical protein